MMITKSECKLLSSLEKVFFDFPYETPEQTGGSMLKNEIYSFQFVFYLESKERYINGRIKLDSLIDKYIKMYYVDYVPSTLPAFTDGTADGDEDYITKKPGVFPDVLRRMKNDKFRIMSGSTVCIWAAVEPDGAIFGDYDINFEVLDDEDGIVCQSTYKLHIINKQLPKQTLINTGWFHGDCIGKLHNVEIGSGRYYDIVNEYLEVYAKFGHNMILTPVFTPPLDTAVGAERLANQLVAVRQTNGKYVFDFERLGFWIDMCESHGIEYFEISHLFTQWGAEFAPKIMAETDGGYKRIFGWDTPALSKEYVGFLSEFLPQLVAFLKKKGVYEKCFFHTSDEPKEEYAKQYEAASKIVRRYVGGERMLDALSDYIFYEKGMVKRPVVASDHINAFLEHGVKNLWAYYCSSQSHTVANRFMAMPAYRNRILGYQLYKNNIEGFLHWGFNFWFSLLSQETINPYYVTDAKHAYPSGDCFIVYPMDEMDEVVISPRLYVFNEALQDMRALELLEKLTDRTTAEGIISEVVRFDKYPHEAEYILNVRKTINQMIEECPGE